MGGLTRKLFTGFGAVAGVLVFVVALLIAILTAQSGSLGGALRDNYDSVQFCDQMKQALDQGQALAHGVLYGGGVMDRDALGMARASFEASAAQQMHNLTLPGERARSQEALDSGRAFFDQVERMAKASTAEQKLALYEGGVFPSYQKCRSVTSDVSQMNLRSLADVNGQIRGALLVIRNTVVILLLAGLGLTLVFVWLVARGMIRPLMQLTNSVRQIEAGNLDSVVEEDSGDEIGLLAQAFNQMAARLREYRRLDHQRLMRTEQTTQAAIDSLPDAVAVMDVHGTIEIANRTAQVHFKLTPGAQIAEIRPDWAAAFFRPVLETQRAVVPDGYRSAIQLFDESGERFLLPRAVPMFDPQGVLIGVTLTLVEVTHLRRADEFKSGLLSTVSHELKTPLTSVRMAIRLLLDNRLGELNEKQQKLLAAAKTDSERLVRTLEDILTIGRVEAGRARLEMTTQPAREIVERAMAPVESSAAERRIELRTEYGEGVPEVRADMTLLACALTNLLSNAIKFSPAGSAVRVRVVRVEEQWEFAVADQGPGIPEEHRVRIFEKFYRIPVPGGPTGAGLGLSIAAEIVHLHGGTIDVRGAEGKGSEFFMRIPMGGDGASHP